MGNEIISVIIPVYNSAEYLEKCLDSVINQTYRHLEIILVDDGSTDESGKICDAYAAKDKRLKVIHKENGGVASARNTGLDAVTGDYIGWVDSDDWIEAEMFETMLAAAGIHDADIVICSRMETYTGHSIQMGWQQAEVLDRTQAVALLAEDDVVRSYLCDKLWKRGLFQEIRIPPLNVFEDMAAMYQLFTRTERIVCLPDVLYHYEHHETGLTATPSLESRMDFYRINKRRYENLKRDFPPLAQRLEPVLVEAGVHIWAVYYDSPKEERKAYHAQIMDISIFGRKHYKAALKNNQLGIAGKIVIRLIPYPYWWSFAAAYLIGVLYKIKHGRAL